MKGNRVSPTGKRRHQVKATDGLEVVDAYDCPGCRARGHAQTVIYRPCQICAAITAAPRLRPAVPDSQFTGNLELAPEVAAAIREMRKTGIVDCRGQPQRPPPRKLASLEDRLAARQEPIDEQALRDEEAFVAPPSGPLRRGK